MYYIVEVARQLTLIEEENFRLLTPLDFITRGRNELDKVPRLKAIVEQFEKVSYWVATEICVRYELSDRIETLQRFLHIAKLCWDWHNFSSCMAICGALNMNAVTRLILTWQGINTECRKYWEFLKEVTSFDNCYGIYRQTASTCSGPGIPYSGSHTQKACLCQERYKDRQPGMYNVKRLK
jgi:hypothetical protein